MTRNSKLTLLLLACVAIIGVQLGRTYAYTPMLATQEVGVKISVSERNGNALRPYNENGNSVAEILPVVYFGNSLPAPSVTMQWGDSVSDSFFGNSVKNAVDQITFVKNTGTADVYVRVWFAFEQGNLTDEEAQRLILRNYNDSHWDWSAAAFGVKIDGNTYTVVLAEYKNSSGYFALQKDQTTLHPSLLQVFFDRSMTPEQTQRLDGNYNLNFDVLFCAQASLTADAWQNTNIATDHPWYQRVVTNKAELLSALNDKEKTIYLGESFTLDATVEIPESVTIYGKGHTVSRAAGFTGTLFSVPAEKTLTIENVVLDGGALWTGTVDPTLQRGETNTGVTATGNLIATNGNGSIVLNPGAVLQNNVGAHAVSLATRGGGSLTINGGEILNNASDSGAIWGGGLIVLNSGKINGNSSSGLAGAIRMVSSCNMEVHGGEINHNKAATDGGVIWGYGSSTYTFTGGEMAYNEAGGTGGAIYTGTYSILKISNSFEMHDNKAANSGAIRLTDHTSLTMTGGKIYGNTQNGQPNAFNTWNNTVSLTGGEISDDISYVGGLNLTVGAAKIDGVISYDLSTNHNTAYLSADFNGFKFKVNENAENFSAFHFKPADGYVYTAGDEAKLICLTPGYETVWDAASGTFKLQQQ